MKHFAIGWACNLNDLFVRFPYEKCKNLMKLYKLKSKRIAMVKQIFKTGVEVILNDIVENNSTFVLPSIGHYKGEIHFEPVTGEEFEKVRSKGKFPKIDFLETMFTGYQLFLYIKSRGDDFLARKKFPIYMSKRYRDRIAEKANAGQTYG